MRLTTALRARSYCLTTKQNALSAYCSRTSPDDPPPPPHTICIQRRSFASGDTRQPSPLCLQSSAAGQSLAVIRAALQAYKTTQPVKTQFGRTYPTADSDICTLCCKISCSTKVPPQIRRTITNNTAKHICRNLPPRTKPTKFLTHAIKRCQASAAAKPISLRTAAAKPVSLRRLLPQKILCC